MRFEELQYRVMHRLGYRPWERYHRLAADSIAARLDAGCLQSLDADGRAALGRGVTALATSGASLLVNAFDRTRLAPVIGGITADEVTAAFPDWQLLVTEAAPVTGLGWPMNTTSPRWYRLRFTGPRSECYGA